MQKIKGNYLVKLILVVIFISSSVVLSFAEGYITPITSSYKFSKTSDLIFKENGDILVVDRAKNNIVLLKEGKGELFAGYTFKGETSGYGGDYLDAKAEWAFFNQPFAISEYRDGYAVSDSKNNAIRFIVNGEVSTIAGGEKGEPYTFNNPLGIAYDIEKDILYIADSGNGRICKLSPDGTVSTYAEGFVEPAGLCIDNEILYVTDAGSHQIVAVRNGQKTLVAGLNYLEEEVLVGGFVDGEASKAMFSCPQGIAVKGKDIYVADTENSAIRLIKNGMVSTLCFCDGNKGDIYPGKPTGIKLQEDQLYVADSFAGRIFKVETDKVLFNDVTPNSWYAPYVSYARVNEIMQGVGNNRFAPEQNVTKAELVTILYNREGNPKIEATAPKFTDVSESDYYKDSARWAVSKGIVKSGEQFGGNQALTREETMQSIFAYGKLKGYPMMQTNSNGGFKDSKSINSEYLTAVNWAVENKIIIGKENKIEPKALISRAEVAVIFMKTFELLG